MNQRLVCSVLSFGALLAIVRPVHADELSEAGRWAVGTSAWMLANVLPDSPQFAFAQVERRLGERDGLVLEALTWRYRGPIGIPFWSSSFGGGSATNYPGSVRSVGAGLGWRHELYRGLNVSARALHLVQFYAERSRPTKTGYQLFLQARIGWRWPARPGLWIEPALAFNAWPIEIGRPASFVAQDDRWPSYFLFEPWLNLGWSW